MAGSDSAGPGFGANAWLVEEMYEQYRADPDSVGESWREFFEDYRSLTAAAHPSPPADAPPPLEPPTATAPATSSTPAPASASRSRASGP